MNQRNLQIRYFALFVVSLLPLLSVLNCEGWNSGTMKFESCMVDTPLLREFGNFVIGWAFVSSFIGGIPIWIYFGIIIFFMRRLYQVTFRFEAFKEKKQKNKAEGKRQ